MLQLRDKHRRHAVQRGAALFACRRQNSLGLEAFRRIDHRRPVCDRRQVSEDHSEAVIKRHRDADAIFLRDLHHLAHEVAVVEDVVVGERRPLREPCGTAGELDVDGIVELKRIRDRIQPALILGCAGVHEIPEAHHSPLVVRPQMDHEFQRREPLGLQGAGPHLRLDGVRLGLVQLGHQLSQHPDVVAALEARRGNKRSASDLVERVFELGEAVRRVDVHEDQAGLGGRELGDRPLGVIGRPHADAIARLEAEGQEAGGAAVHSFAKFRIRPADRLVSDDQCFPFRISIGSPVEGLTDGRVQERRGRSTVYIAQGRR